MYNTINAITPTIEGGMAGVVFLLLTTDREGQDVNRAKLINKGLHRK